MNIDDLIPDDLSRGRDSEEPGHALQVLAMTAAALGMFAGQGEQRIGRTVQVRHIAIEGLPPHADVSIHGATDALWAWLGEQGATERGQSECPSRVLDTGALTVRAWRDRRGAA